MDFQTFINKIYDLSIGKAYFYLLPEFKLAAQHLGEESVNNCYKLTWYMGTDVEPALDGLDLILEHFCPNITVLQYNSIYREIVKTGSNHLGFSEDTVFYKKFRYHDLWVALSDRGFI